MALTPLTRPFPYIIPPITNITPFTYRDGVTFLEMLEDIRTVIRDGLIPEMDERLDFLFKEFQAGIANAEATITWSLAEWLRLFNKFMEDVEAALGPLNDAAIARLMTIPSLTSAAINKRIDERAGVHAYTFGMVADGVTDDTKALKAFLTHMATVGGVGILPVGSILYKEAWGVAFTPTNPSKSFIIRGAGMASTILKYQGPATGASALNLAGATFQDMTFDGGFKETRQVGHALSFFNPHDIYIERCHFTNYASSAALFHVADNELALKPSGNYLVDCTYDGMDIANNGFNFVNVSDSYMVNPVGKRLGVSAANSPSYGAQLKNGCRNSHIVNAVIDGALAGIVFASDTSEAGSGPQHCSATGQVSNSDYGLLIGKANNNNYSVEVDMNGRTDLLRAVSIGGKSLYNSVELTLHNVPASLIPVYVNAHECTVVIKQMSSEVAKIFEIAPGADRAKLVVQSYTGEAINISSKLLDNSGRPNNRISSFDGMAGFNATTDDGGSYLKFNSPSTANTWMAYNHLTDTFNWRGTGIDMLGLSATALLPGADNGQALGTPGRMWSEVFASSGVISAADRRDKQQVSTNLSAELAAWEKVEYVKFKFTDSVNKNGESASIHFGLMTEQVKAAFESEGLDPFAYGILCYDDSKTGGVYGIRYQEAAMLEAALIRWKLANP